MILIPLLPRERRNGNIISINTRLKLINGFFFFVFAPSKEKFLCQSKSLYNPSVLTLNMHMQLIRKEEEVSG